MTHSPGPSFPTNTPAPPPTGPPLNTAPENAFPPLPQASATPAPFPPYQAASVPTNGFPPPVSYTPTPDGPPPAHPYPAHPYQTVPHAGFAAENYVPLRLAFPLQRGIARCLDEFVVVVVLGLFMAFFLGLPMETLENVDTSLSTAVLIIISVIFFAGRAFYEIVMIATKGATLGKLALGIRVVDETTGTVPSWKNASLRFLLPSVPIYLSYLIVSNGIFEICALLIYLSFFFDEQKQGWHDKAGKTYVVRT